MIVVITVAFLYILLLRLAVLKTSIIEYNVRLYMVFIIIYMLYTASLRYEINELKTLRYRLSINILLVVEMN